MSVRDYIEHLKAQPEAHRRRVALASSAIVTFVVALGWFGVMASSGAFTLTSAPNQATADLAKTTEAGGQQFNDLVGAVGAFQQEWETGEPIQVIDGTESSSLETGSTGGEQTVIPF